MTDELTETTPLVDGMTICLDGESAEYDAGNGLFWGAWGSCAAPGDLFNKGWQVVQR